MGKVIKEYETEYEVGDVVIFEKHGLEVGIIDGYYVEDNCFWFNNITNQNTCKECNNWHYYTVTDKVKKVKELKSNNCNM